MSNRDVVFDVKQIHQAVCHLKQGGVLAYPSESVWGLGCSAFCESAIARIFELKNRPMHKGVIVLTDSANKLQPLLTDLSAKEQADIMHAIAHTSVTDQATTWLVPVSQTACVPKMLTGGFDTLAVRVTTHPILKKICQELTDDVNPYGFLVSTSCNLSNQDPARSLQQAWAYFGNQVGYLDAHSLGYQKPSRIIDAQTGRQVR